MDCRIYWFWNINCLLTDKTECRNCWLCWHWVTDECICSTIFMCVNNRAESLEQFLPRYNFHGWQDIKNQMAMILSVIICESECIDDVDCVLSVDTDKITGLIPGWFFVDRNESMTICGLTVMVTVLNNACFGSSVVRMLIDEYVGSNIDCVLTDELLLACWQLNAVSYTHLTLPTMAVV